MIRIEETKNEYLLFIPSAQKERARGIQGRKWDPQRICWVYPRNVRMYHALIAEFVDDLTPESSFSSPQPLPRQEKIEDQETTELRHTIERIDQTLSELLNFLDHTDNERTNILIKQEREIQSLRVESKRKSEENDEEINKLKRQIDQLQAENSLIKSPSISHIL